MAVSLSCLHPDDVKEFSNQLGLPEVDNAFWHIIDISHSTVEMNSIELGLAIIQKIKQLEKKNEYLRKLDGIINKLNHCFEHGEQDIYDLAPQIQHEGRLYYSVLEYYLYWIIHNFLSNKRNKEATLRSVINFFANYQEATRYILQDIQFTLIQYDSRTEKKKAARNRHTATNKKKQEIIELWYQECKKEKPLSMNQFAKIMSKKMNLAESTIRKNYLQGLPSTLEEFKLRNSLAQNNIEFDEIPFY